MARNSTSSTRLEARLSPQALALIKRAAEIEGRSVSDFVVTAARQAAQRAIAATQVIHLALANRRALAEALGDPPKPAPALRRGQGASPPHRRDAEGVGGVARRGEGLLRNADVSRVEPGHLGFEIETQLRGLLLGKPVRHLWKDGFVKRSLFRLRRQRLRRSRLGQNLVKLGAHLVRIGAIHRRWRVLVEQGGLGFRWEEIAWRGDVTGLALTCPFSTKKSIVMTNDNKFLPTQIRHWRKPGRFASLLNL
jgi:uncharacterized protein (DUF1778 family)